MKLIIISVALFAAFNFVLGELNEERLPRKKLASNIYYNRRKNFLQKSINKFKFICPEREKDLNIAILKVKNCTNSIDVNEESACSAIRTHFLTCTKPFVETLQSCVPDESKEVPKIVFEMINSGANYACKADGEHILELTDPCILKGNYLRKSCENIMVSKFDQYKKKLPSKEEFCGTILWFEDCLSRRLATSCFNKVTKEASTGLIKALTAPCRSH